MRIFITLCTLFLAGVAIGQEISPEKLVDFAKKEGRNFPAYSIFVE